LKYFFSKAVSFFTNITCAPSFKTSTSSIG
jgi:hypothetical protein